MRSAEQTTGFHALLVLMAMHFLVDVTAGMVSPLWPDIEVQCRTGATGTFWLLMIWMLSTSMSQLGFALIGNTVSGGWLLWCGPIISGLCLGGVAFSSDIITTLSLLLLAGTGIAAFHPEGATRAGNTLPDHRSRAMSFFSTAGFLGQSVGPAISGTLVAHHGLIGLTAGTISALVCLLMLAGFIRLNHSPPKSATRQHKAEAPPWSVISDHRGTIGLLLLTGVLRVIPASGIPVIAAYWLRSLGEHSDAIGITQSSFMFGIGLGGLIAALFVTHRTERLTLTVLPIIAAPCVIAFPLVNRYGLYSAMFISGLTLGMAQPVFISLGQQLLSSNRRIGSSITMGVSWGLGGMIVAGLTDYCNTHHQFQTAFIVFAACIVSSCLFALLLPKAPRSGDPPS
jgi:FSR family fosmidomycin resistance protein-like MFS transporter